LAQPYSAGSGKAENRCIGNESCQSAEPVRTSARAKSYGCQASAHTEVGEPIETTARTTTVALGQAVVRSALTQTDPLIKTWNF